VPDSGAEPMRRRIDVAMKWPLGYRLWMGTHEKKLLPIMKHNEVGCVRRVRPISRIPTISEST
jgi:hypothetical protein